MGNSRTRGIGNRERRDARGGSAICANREKEKATAREKRPPRKRKSDRRGGHKKSMGKLRGVAPGALGVGVREPARAASGAGSGMSPTLVPSVLSARRGVARFALTESGGAGASSRRRTSIVCSQVC